MFISWILIFIHPGSNNSTKRGGGGKNLLSYHFFCRHKYHKILNYFIFQQVKKFFSLNTKNYSTFYRKNLSLIHQKYGFGIRDPGSEKTYSESRIQGKKGTGSRIRNIDSWQKFSSQIRPFSCLILDIFCIGVG